MTWIDRGSAGFVLAVNRDESRARSAEGPPGIALAGRTRFLAPRDGAAGGIWMAVNEHGLALALLNGYEPGDVRRARAGAPSRGTLLASLAGFATQGEVAEELAGRDLSPYASFVLLLLAPGAPALVARCGAAGLAFAPHLGPPLLCSSGFDQAAAQAARLELWHALASAPWDEERQRAFHASHLPARGALSPCMHREDAATRSFSVVRVAPGEVALSWSPAAPCRDERAETLVLARAATPNRASPAPARPLLPARGD